MTEAVIDQAYLETTGTSEGREFVHITLRQIGTEHAVEEVAGSIDANGKRRGEIRQIAVGLALGPARDTFEAQIGQRTATGYHARE